MLEVEPISKARSLLEWYHDRNLLDMEPSYQRRSDLWPEKHKQLLINSVLNKYDVPKIYVADFTYNDSSLKEVKKPYAIIDGKQRLSTIYSFFENKLQLDNTPVFFENKTIVLKGYTYDRLKEDYYYLAKRFEDYIPTVMSVITNNLEEVQELFIRLNLNVSISGPERRNAMAGPIPPYIKKISVHRFFRENATFPINRGQDLNASAKMLFYEEKCEFTPTKKADLDKFVKSYPNNTEASVIGLYERTVSVLDLMSIIFVKNDKELLHSQTQLLLYYQLIKRHGLNHNDRIRSFLRQFETRRRLVRREANARAKGSDVKLSDEELQLYNELLRTPDDKSKQESMYRIMERRFNIYLSSTFI
ncbi:DUF262 domain-containing protein [Dehalogenimonas alkenigignens]|uniref:DUF262 domain-containing protein n=1 Tax=Dehalogenimonas alkenigignens TaxID=1217799 RepID=UPI001402CDE8|nr:DUF262 domain-containing protein [Dehalogenimonas alkenigignens]